MKPFILIVLSLILFVSCQQKLSEKQILYYKNQGDKIVKNTGETLSGMLMQQLKEGGVPQAVTFCSTEAIPMTKKLSDRQGVHIKRTSLKFRNIQNKPSPFDKTILNYYQDKKAQNDSLKPVIKLDDKGNPRYFAPIIVQKKCLVCHGKVNENMAPATDSIIKSRYPSDLAVGYHEGDLRGMWSITF